MFIIPLPKLRKPEVVQDEKGFTLVEAVISIVLISIIAAALFTGLGTASKVLLHTDSKETAKNVAETQMEFVKGQDFNAGSGTGVYIEAPIQSGYSAVIDAEPVSVIPTGQTARDGYVQQITITVTGPNNITYSLTDYKVK